MSVDKFGRHSEDKLKRPLRGPKGDGFNLTEDGDYDIKNKRLRFVQDPIDNGDVVNLKTLHSKSIVLGDTGYTAKNKRIANVGVPEKANDAVTKFYVDRRMPFTSNKVNYWSFNEKRLASVSEPKDNGDAVNLEYFQKFVPEKTECCWDFKNMRLANTAIPQEINDAVNVKFLKDNTLCKRSTEIEGNAVSGHGLEFDAQGSIISNVGNPQNLDDVVTKRYLKEALADLGYAIYKNIINEKYKGLRSYQPTDPEMWKYSLGRAFDTMTPWDAWDMHLYRIPYPV